GASPVTTRVVTRTLLAHACADRPCTAGGLRAAWARASKRKQWEAIMTHARASNAPSVVPLPGACGVNKTERSREVSSSRDQSGRVDSNHRPLDPQSSALTRLRYAPERRNRPAPRGLGAKRERTLPEAPPIARFKRRVLQEP